MTDIIQVTDLVKRYRELIALNHFNLTVEKGEIYGLLGPNGSGKTTAINCILGILKFDRGQVKVFGEEMHPDAYHLKRDIGMVPQEIALLEELTVRQNIDFFCNLYVQNSNKRKQLVQEAIEFVGLEDFVHFRPSKLSGGLKRRLNIACGIAHKPKLIFLDEPTVAVDTQSRNQILEGIKDLNRQGATILYTTHYMEEVEQICSRIMIMDKGVGLITGTKEELRDAISVSEKMEIELFQPHPQLIKEIEALPFIKNITIEENRLYCDAGKERFALATILRILERHDAPYGRIVSHEPTLNDVFLEITGKELRDRV